MDMYVDDVNNKFKVDLFTESLSCITFDIFTDSLKPVSITFPLHLTGLLISYDIDRDQNTKPIFSSLIVYIQCSYLLFYCKEGHKLVLEKQISQLKNSRQTY